MERRAPKKGKKNRKHGRGLRKVQRSRFGSYAALFAASRERKLKRIESRKRRLARRRARRSGSHGPLNREGGVS